MSHTLGLYESYPMITLIVPYDYIRYTPLSHLVVILLYPMVSFQSLKWYPTVILSYPMVILAYPMTIAAHPMRVDPKHCDGEGDDGDDNHITTMIV